MGTKDPEQATDPDLAYSELVERFCTLVSDPFGQDSDKPGGTDYLTVAYHFPTTGGEWYFDNQNSTWVTTLVFNVAITGVVSFV